MREIKFRAWVTPPKGRRFKPFMTDDLVIASDGSIAIQENIAFEHHENVYLLQYTGLKDKNGVEIYEGDLMTFGSDTFQVLWHNAGFSTQSVGNKLPTGRMDTHHCKAWIIGNIYENPELLEANQ